MVTGDNTDVDCNTFTYDSVAKTFSFTPTAMDYTNAVYRPGSWTVTIKGEVVDSDPSLTKSTTLTVELVDPCGPPDQINAVSIADQEYTITAPSVEFTHNQFIVVPSYCDIVYSFEETELVGGTSAVVSYDVDTQTFNFFYDTDLTPALDGESQTIKVIATSSSIYTNNMMISES